MPFAVQLRDLFRGPVLALALVTAGAGAGPAAAQQSPVQQRANPEARVPDVHFVPTPTEAVDQMLTVTRVSARDLVYDLGCGDGRIVIAAAKRYGARGVCVDIDPERIKESKQNAAAAGVTEKIRFVQGDLFETDFRDATVVTLYLLPSLNVRLRPKLFEELRPGTRVASHSFDMGDWKEDSILSVPTADSGDRTVYYWVIPANAAGTWEVTTDGKGGTKQRFTVRIEQKYQKIEGMARVNGRDVPLEEPTLRGDRISFALKGGSDKGSVTERYTGRVEGSRIHGTTPSEGSGGGPAWSAVRVKAGPPISEPPEEGEQP